MQQLHSARINRGFACAVFMLLLATYIYAPTLMLCKAKSSRGLALAGTQPQRGGGGGHPPPPLYGPQTAYRLL